MLTQHKRAEVPQQFAEMVIDASKQSTLEELAEPVADKELPPLDRLKAPFWLSSKQAFWREHGYLIVKRLIPDELIEPYCAVREKFPDAGSFPSPVPYLQVKELRDLCLFKPLADILKSLLSVELGLNLNLCNWTSTERNWHQDDYLNSPHVNSWYAAVWIALDDIHPDSGPFEFVPGSHKWPLIRGAKVQALLKPEYRDHGAWPKFAEYVTNLAFENAISRTKSDVRQFIARKGDVLIWHGRLAHRGSEPRQPGMRRKSCIAHFTALSKHPEIKVARTQDGVAYFIIPGFEFDMEEFIAKG